MNAELHVHVVDDDEAVRESLQMLLEAVGFTTCSFSSGREFLDGLGRGETGCVLLDVQMPDMSGLQIQEKLTEMGLPLPVIIMTGHGDVPLAVRAMKAGAFDFLEKPVLDDVLLDSVRSALAFGKRSRKEQIPVEQVKTKIAQLTPREREVFDQLVIGRPNKLIAYHLGISARTVEIHRARVMQKVQAGSLSELVRMAVAAGIDPGPE